VPSQAITAPWSGPAQAAAAAPALFALYPLYLRKLEILRLPVQSGHGAASSRQPGRSAASRAGFAPAGPARQLVGLGRDPVLERGPGRATDRVAAINLAQLAFLVPSSPR
jgi:hypothetical protein